MFLYAPGSSPLNLSVIPYPSDSRKVHLFKVEEITQWLYEEYTHRSYLLHKVSLPPALRQTMNLRYILYFRKIVDF